VNSTIYDFSSSEQNHMMCKNMSSFAVQKIIQV